MSACPACGSPLFGWLVIESDQDDAGGEPIVLERCERCRLGVAAGLAPSDAVSELLGSARQISDGKLELRVANRASVQASLGGRHWAALEPKRRLYPTPQSLRPLAAAAGLEIEEVRFPRRRRGQVWMWQTIVNSFTFHENFASKVRAGNLRSRGTLSRLKFGIDAVVTALAAIPVAVVSAPLELVSALLGRGGELAAVARRSET